MNHDIYKHIRNNLISWDIAKVKSCSANFMWFFDVMNGGISVQLYNQVKKKLKLKLIEVYKVFVVVVIFNMKHKFIAYKKKLIICRIFSYYHLKSIYRELFLITYHCCDVTIIAILWVSSTNNDWWYNSIFSKVNQININYSIKSLKMFLWL